MVKVAILFDNFGPYHLARLRAATGVCDVLAVEFGSSSAEYDWKASEAAGLRRVVLNPKGESHQMSNDEFRLRIDQILREYKPDVVVVPGWGYRGARLALKWCLANTVPAVVMSESTAWDDVRKPLKEWVKQRIISLFSAALVGGTPHRSYMRELGMPADRIFLGYDVVDNSFFEAEGSRLKAKGEKERGLRQEQHPCFLASARFIQKKNLFRIIRAYARYRQGVESHRDGCGVPAGPATSSVGVQPRQQSPNKEQLLPWDLVLLGDGELRSELEKLRSELGLEDCIQMPGFKQYEELPGYYAHAGAFIHASTTEQWGLVVNEAMASGLPVLVSNRCGCATDLVQDGVNGWTFDPTSEEQLADLMLKISSDETRRSEMGVKSQQIISEWGPDRFASGLSEAIQAALAAPRKRAGLLDRLILKMMTRR